MSPEPPWPGEREPEQRGELTRHQPAFLRGPRGLPAAGPDPDAGARYEVVALGMGVGGAKRQQQAGQDGKALCHRSNLAISNRGDGTANENKAFDESYSAVNVQKPQALHVHMTF